VNNSLGQAINLTGAQCFIKVNSVNLLLGASTVNVPPALPSFIAVTVTGLTATAGTQLLEAAGTTPASGTSFMFFCSPQVSAGVSFQGNFRYIANFTTATAGEFVLTTPYTTKFGALIAGKKIFVKVVQQQAGMQDNGTLFSTIVGA
jgi:hypothetical protein